MPVGCGRGRSGAIHSLRRAFLAAIHYLSAPLKTAESTQALSAASHCGNLIWEVGGVTAEPASSPRHRASSPPRNHGRRHKLSLRGLDTPDGPDGADESDEPDWRRKARRSILQTGHRETPPLGFVRRQRADVPSFFSLAERTDGPDKATAGPCPLFGANPLCGCADGVEQKASLMER